jgi:DNA-binding CsgD family transcriptional regulator
LFCSKGEYGGAVKDNGRLLMEEIFRKNEAETNEFVARAINFILLFILLFGALCWTGIFNIDSYIINGFIISSLIPLIIPIILMNLLHANHKWVKYVLILCTVLFAGIAYVFFTFQTVLVFIIPSILATFYLSKKMMAFTTVTTIITIAASHLITVFHLFQPWIEPFQGMGPIMLYGALPRMLQYLCCMILLYILNIRYSKFFHSFYSVLKEEQKDKEMNIDRSELDAATRLLTEREMEVFELMVKGFTNLEIAKQLYITNGTVKNYVSTIYDKIGIRDRTALILKYSRYYQSHR